MNINTISVVCPAYNSESFIENTIKSVLTQTQLPSELIIVDDGSTDNTITIINKIIETNKNLSITLICQQHLGPGAARNAGIRASKSTWVAFLDSDDLWYPNKIEIVNKYIINQPKTNFFCHNEYIYQDNRNLIPINYSRGYCEKKSLSKQLFKRNYFSTSAVVLKRDLLNQNGLFNEKLSSAQDYELWLRLSPNLKITFINEILGVYKIRFGNISNSKFWKRLINLINVKLIHIEKANIFYSIYVLFRDIFYHLMTPIISCMKRIKKNFS